MIIYSNCMFQETYQEEASRFALNQETKQVMLSKEEIAVTDESVKDVIVSGFWKI